MPLTCSDLPKLCCALFIPPVGVLMEYGCDMHFCISVLLSLLFWIPGVCYACYVINTHASKEQKKRSRERSESSCEGRQRSNERRGRNKPEISTVMDRSAYMFAPGLAGVGGYGGGAGYGGGGGNGGYAARGYGGGGYGEVGYGGGYGGGRYGYNDGFGSQGYQQPYDLEMRGAPNNGAPNQRRDHAYY